MKPKLNIQFVEAVAQGAGAILLKYLSRLKQHQIHPKGFNDYATEADHLSEHYLKKQILKNFLDHEIMAEESFKTSSWRTVSREIGERPLWIIDPLDGTANFMHGFPVFTVSIGVRLQGHTQLAVVFDPTRNELFSAVRGKGAYLNHKRIKVSRTKKLQHSLLSTGFPFRCMNILEHYIRIFRQLTQQSQGIRRTGSAALDLCYVACGRYDGFWEFDLYPWDTAAGTLIIEEAQGRVTNFKGKELALSPQNVLAGNSAIHGQILKVVHASKTMNLDHDGVL